MSERDIYREKGRDSYPVTKEKVAISRKPCTFTVLSSLVHTFPQQWRHRAVDGVNIFVVGHWVGFHTLEAAVVSHFRQCLRTKISLAQKSRKLFDLIQEVLEERIGRVERVSLWRYVGLYISTDLSGVENSLVNLSKCISAN